ncbi:hypothetical protein C4J81_11525 [Deltaproteobacteria bacterium Smac51]|nr:hypothetical protein C4J81_11525 [Deltaproteobacteria bacterium Smac51]
MGGLMTVMGIASQVASLVSPYVSNSASYSDQKRQAEAAALKTQMQVDSYLNKAEDQEWNARQAELQAEAAKHAGTISEAEAAEAAYKAKARQRALLAQNGTLNSATGTVVLDQADSDARSDQFKIQHKTGREIQGYLSDAEGYRRQADNYRQTASQTVKAAQLTASANKSTSKTNSVLNGIQTANSLLGTVSSVYSLFR